MEYTLATCPFFRDHLTSQQEAGATFIELGQRLQHAKGRVAHGDWLPELKKAGIPVQVAQRAMWLANAGVNASPVTHLGIRRSLELLARGKDGDPMTGAGGQRCSGVRRLPATGWPRRRRGRNARGRGAGLAGRSEGVDERWRRRTSAPGSMPNRSVTHNGTALLIPKIYNEHF